MLPAPPWRISVGLKGCWDGIVVVWRGGEVVICVAI